MRALLGLDELQRRADGVRGRIGRAAEQSVGLAHLDEHRAEIVALGERRAAVLLAHLALAQLDHLGDHLIHALVGGRIDDRGLADAEVALFRSSLDLVNIADEDDVHQVVLEQTVGRFEDPGIGAFGEDNGAAGGLQSVDQLCKHMYYLQFCGLTAVIRINYTTDGGVTQPQFLKLRQFRLI